ncbi:MAG: enoyl-CoA hydratase [Chloroflexi bacterium HGW-Chloroflexi-9]|nr:MAG: enoyl-CoA hydratase [Chloroflexi bacterium HGW-Chloroflexi-9]
MDFEEIVYDVERGVATITFYRPEKMNAQTRRLTEETNAALDLAAADDAVRAVIFTGAGRAFCAGSDMSAGPSSAPADGSAPPASNERTSSITMRLFDFPKPVIAAVNGAAVGFGASSLLAMDIRICSTQGRFGFVYVKRGIAPESAASWFLPRIVGVEQALSWLYSGRVFGAEEALKGGLVSEVVEPDALMDRAREIADEIVGQSAPLTVAFTRQAVWKGLSTLHPHEAWLAESGMGRALRGSPDSKEGVVSFLEQRAPVFVGKVSELPDDVWPKGSAYILE